MAKKNEKEEKVLTFDLTKKIKTVTGETIPTYTTLYRCERCAHEGGDRGDDMTFESAIYAALGQATKELTEDDAWKRHKLTYKINGSGKSTKLTPAEIGDILKAVHSRYSKSPLIYGAIRAYLNLEENDG
jgi:hypothetical protein